MSIHYSPPHVVHSAYANSTGLKDISKLYVRMAANVYVMEQRLSADDMLMMNTVGVTLRELAFVKEANLTDLYKPVWKGAKIKGPGNTGDVDDYRGMPGHSTETDPPFSWWLRLSLVEASERARFPMLPAKINMKEWLDMGTIGELYSWDGTGFKLRETDWGRE